MNVRVHHNCKIDIERCEEGKRRSLVALFRAGDALARDTRARYIDAMLPLIDCARATDNIELAASRAPSVSLSIGAKQRARERPPRCARGGSASNHPEPDHGKHAVVVLAGGRTVIGVELAGSELGRGKREAQAKSLALLVAAPAPAGANLDAIGPMTLKAAWVQALLSRFGMMSISARIETVLSRPLQLPLSFLGRVSDRGRTAGPVLVSVVPMSLLLGVYDLWESPRR